MTRCVAGKRYEEDGSLNLYLTAFGHANYGERGKDIVCAAVSALCTSLANTLLGYGVPEAAFRMREGNFFVSARMEENQQKCEGAFDMAVVGLESLADQYPDNVFIASGWLH